MSVIQGSILGPILFLVYIDDFPFSSLLETFIFADDTQGLKAGKNLPELIDKVSWWDKITDGISKFIGRVSLRV